MAEKTIIIKGDTFSVENLSVSPFYESQYNKSQLIAKPIYNNNLLTIQSEWMEYNVHGIKKLSDFVTCDEMRDYINIPLNYKDIKKVKPLRDSLKSIDKYLGSDSFKKEHLNEKTFKNYKYTNLVRLPEPVENEKEYVPKNDNFKHVNRYDVEYVKAKFSYSYNGDGKTINTKLYHRVDGKIEEKTFSNTTELTKLIPFGSEVRYIIQLYKVGVMKVKDEYKNLKYGANFKLLLIEVKPRISKIVDSITCADLLEDEDVDEKEEESEDDDEEETEEDDE